MLLYCVGMNGLFVGRLVCCLVGVVMGCMDGDEFVGIVEDCVLHHAGWVRIIEESI